LFDEDWEVEVFGALEVGVVKGVANASLAVLVVADK